jgi:hypothetical protein
MDPSHVIQLSAVIFVPSSIPLFYPCGKMNGLILNVTAVHDEATVQARHSSFKAIRKEEEVMFTYHWISRTGLTCSHLLDVELVSELTVISCLLYHTSWCIAHVMVKHAMYVIFMVS